MKKGIFFIALAAICGSMLLCAPVKSEAKKISSLSAAKKMAKKKVKKMKKFKTWSEKQIASIE